VEAGPDGPRRKYQGVPLERAKIFFLPLSWTIVHPLDDNSPLHGLGAEDLERLQAEFLILVKCFDDTFSQTVHARYSYTFDEIDWASRFLPAFDITSDGDLEFDVSQLDRSAKA
jgi:inward rectifier potassium channel